MAKARIESSQASSNPMKLDLKMMLNVDVDSLVRLGARYVSQDASSPWWMNATSLRCHEKVAQMKG